MTPTALPAAATIGALTERLRARAPLVHCVTNFVAMSLTANALIAAGAAPAMVHAPEEAGRFAGAADALAVNIGTPDALWAEGMRAAVDGARAACKPWALDPVAAFVSPFRLDLAASLLDRRPTLVRGNASEILALAGFDSAARGVDAREGVEAAAEAARRLARRTGGVVAITGPVDLATDGGRIVRVANGHPTMPQVSALGCALTAVAAGFLAVADDPLEGTVAALAFWGLAGERAAAVAQGPGSFAVAFLDALAALDGAALAAGARVSA